MNFAIPISRFDPTNVGFTQPYLGQFRRTVNFTYKDNGLAFNTLHLLLEPLRVVDLDLARNQMVLEEVSQIQNLQKIEQLQAIINTQIKKRYAEWLEDTELPDPECIVPSQSWVKSNRVTLFLSNDPSSLPLYIEGGRATISENTIKPGDLIRVVVRLQGFSLQMSTSNTWTGRSRIQHHLVDLYRVKETL
jgi:hypothetical protein